MGNAVTYKDLYLSFGGVVSMDRLEITQSPGQHGKLVLSAVLEGESEGEAFDRLPETVAVQYRQDGKEKILFKGIVADSSMKRVGNYRKVELKAYDATYLLDTERRTRSFQNTARTTHSVIAEVLECYQDCVCRKNLPEEPIGQVWFQYEETDWEFLNRFMGNYADSLYADATYSAARFQAGLSPEDVDVDWDTLSYRIGKDLERYDRLSQNGFRGLRTEQFVEYTVDSHDLYTLGSRLVYKGRRWYVGALKRELREGLLVTAYRLRQRAGLYVPKTYNRRITGISVDGKVTEISRDKVRVTLNGDLTKEQGTYWFPFSTVAASADGSGWYSMPEKGDSIRVYFPTCDEREGYAITMHDSHMPSARGGGSADSKGNGNGMGGGTEIGGNAAFAGTSTGNAAAGTVSGEGSAAVSREPAAVRKTDAVREDPMGDPGKRNIFTKDGCIVQMVPEGVLLASGQSSVTLGKDGTVVFHAPQGICIHAGKHLSINGRNVTMEAGTMVEIKNGKKAYMNMQKTQTKLHGQEIYEN